MLQKRHQCAVSSIQYQSCNKVFVSAEEWLGQITSLISLSISYHANSHWHKALFICLYQFYICSGLFLGVGQQWVSQSEAPGLWP